MPTPIQIATLNAATMRAVMLSAEFKAMEAAKKDALAICRTATLPEGYKFNLYTRTRTTPVYAPEDMEAGESYAMCRAAKDAPTFPIPTLAAEPWIAYEFFALAENTAKKAKDCNAKRLRDAMKEAGVDKWEVPGYGKATLCAGKPKPKEGAKQIGWKDSAYPVEELLTPYKREEIAAHPDEA